MISHIHAEFSQFSVGIYHFGYRRGNKGGSSKILNDYLIGRSPNPPVLWKFWDLY